MSTRRWTDYVPLLVVLAISLLASGARVRADGPFLDGAEWMHDFMGTFLAIFAMLKLFDLSGFADGFQRYDLLAKRFRPYALAYPFVELALALGYLGRWHLAEIYIGTIVVMTFGALGVILALRRKLDLACACMGTALRVPLSTVALVEDVGMAAMAAAMWATQ